MRARARVNTGEPLAGVIISFERKLKELNPDLQELKYDIASLYAYIDKLVCAAP